MNRCILIITIVLGCIYAEQDTTNWQEKIFMWQNQRQPQNLYPLLNHQNSQLRLLSVKALGRIQDTMSIAHLQQSLNDTNKDVRAEAAFALGQMWSQKSEPPLLAAIAKEKDLQVVHLIIEALGKVGSEETIKKFIETFPQKQHSEAVAYASGLLTYRGIYNDDLIRKLITYSMHPSPAIRGHVSYALMRAKQPRTIHRLLQLLYDKNPDCRMNAARGLGYIKNPKAVSHLYVTVNDKNPHVAVNSLNALRSFENVLPEKITPLFTHDNLHISLSAIRLAGDLKLNVSKNLLTLKNTSPLYKGEVFVALAKIAPKLFLQKIASSQTDDILLQTKIAEALGFVDEKDAVTKLRSMLATKNNLVLQTVVASLGKITCEDTTEDIISSLKSLDMAVITYAAEAILNKKATHKLPALMKTYAQLKMPNDIEAMQAIINTVGALTSIKNQNGIDFLQKIAICPHALLAKMAANFLKKLNLTIPSVKKNVQMPQLLFSYKDIKNLPDFVIEVETNKGVFVIRPFSKQAPIAVYNFYQLIQKDFYNNLKFHRVIPNFVVQGGDPRGDGWGGPGYNIPCEYNMLRYQRGMVGMPLAGKDTGGCQLFITHSPQPHLNGKYTIFGQVTKGMEIVDLLQMGDVIIKMNIVLKKQNKNLPQEKK